MKLNETEQLLESEKLKSKTLMGVIGEARQLAYAAVCELNKRLSVISYDPMSMKKEARLVDKGDEISIADHRSTSRMYFNMEELEYLEQVLKILREGKVRE